MSNRGFAVLDSSIGVKWIKLEPGRAEAIALLEEHREGGTRLVVTAHFVHEVLGVAVKHGGPQLGERVWAGLRNADLTVIGLDDTLVGDAFAQCRLLGCSFYDALAPALADRLQATLYSADACAHARFDGVVILGAGR